MPTPLLPSRDDDEHVDGTVVLWKEFGYRPFLDGWNEDPTHKGGEDSVEGRWMPLDTYNALLARANTAKVAADLMRARAERAEEALKWIAAQSCRRDAPCFELNACVTERCETCYARAALASGKARGEG